MQVFGAVWDILPDLNPFSIINKAIKGLYDDLIKLFEDAVTNPPRAYTGEWTTNLFGNALGLSRVLIILVTMFVVLMVLLMKRKIQDVGHAFFVAAMIFIFGQAYFWAMAEAIKFGRLLCQMMQIYDPADDKKAALWLPDIGNLLGSILGLGGIAMLGAILVGIIFSYQIAIILVGFLGLPTYALTPLGERAQKALNVLVSMGLVATVFGPPAAILAMNIGRWMADTIVINDNAFFRFLILAISICFAIWAQFKLFQITLRTVSNVTSKGQAHVKGDVNTRQKNANKVDVRSIRGDRRAARNPVGVPSGAVAVPAGTGSSSKGRGAGGMLLRHAAASLASKTPTGAVATKAAGTAHAVFVNRRGEHVNTQGARTRRPAQQPHATVTHETTVVNGKSVSSGSAPATGTSAKARPVPQRREKAPTPTAHPRYSLTGPKQDIGPSGLPNLPKER